MLIRDDRRQAVPAAIAVRSLKALVLAAVSIATPNLNPAAAEAHL